MNAAAITADTNNARLAWMRAKNAWLANSNAKTRAAYFAALDVYNAWQRLARA